jgi:hypothetical protein
MSGTFHHVEVYSDGGDWRCSVCGATGVVDWIDVSNRVGVRRLVPGRVMCPNGPHQLTLAEWANMAAAHGELAVRPAPMSPERFSDEWTPKRRWWRRGQP